MFSKKEVDFLRRPNYLVLSTFRKDGSVQMTIVWFEYDPESNVFKISTTTDRVKYKNIRRDPRVSFIVWEKGNPYQYLQVRGRVADETKTGAHEFIDHLSEIYTGAKVYHGDPEHQQDRVIITISPENYFSVGVE